MDGDIMEIVILCHEKVNFVQKQKYWKSVFFLWKFDFIALKLSPLDPVKNIFHICK